MLESSNGDVEKDTAKLENVLLRMRQLYAESSGEKSDEERITEGKRQRIGPKTKLACQALIDKTSAELHKVAVQEGWSSEKLSSELFAMEKDITEGIFAEYNNDPNLSSDNYELSGSTYARLMFIYDLRLLMASDPSLNSLNNYGWIMFDVNGLKSFKTCTTHPYTSGYLKEIVRILVDPKGPTRMRLDQLGIRAISTTAGGDEFFLYLRSQSALTEQFIKEVVVSFQKEFSTSETLNKLLNFDDDQVKKKFGVYPTMKKEEFRKLPESQQRAMLDEVRNELPDEFESSVAGGGALLTNGILQAIFTDENDLNGNETFYTLREKIVQGTIDLAEEEQEEDKDQQKQHIERTNPKLYLFQARNSQERKLSAKNMKLSEENRALKESNALLKAEVAKAHEHIARLITQSPVGDHVRSSE